MKVFLTAAAGFVGSRLLDDLLAAGHEVTALAHSDRSLEQLRRLHPELNIARGDVTKAGDMLKAVPSGTEAVIYIPGLLREFPSKGITFRGVHVEGVRNTLAAARNAGATRWIEMSALGTGPHGKTGYFRTKWEAEELVRSSGMQWTILRPSVIFDDRPTKLKTFVNEIAKAIRQLPFIPILGTGKFRLQPVSVDDVSQTIVQALSKPETIGKTYEIGGPEKLTYTEIVTTIARGLHSKKPKLRIPMVLAEVAAKLFQRFAFFPFTTDQLTMLKDENIVKDRSREEEWKSTFTLPLKRFESLAG